MNILIKPIHQFGKLNVIAVHQVVEDIQDFWNAIDEGERHCFPTVVLYVSDLTLMRELTKGIESYHDAVATALQESEG